MLSFADDLDANIPNTLQLRENPKKHDTALFKLSSNPMYKNGNKKTGYKAQK